MLIWRESKQNDSGEHDGRYATGAPLAACVVSEETPNKHSCHDATYLRGKKHELKIMIASSEKSNLHFNLNVASSVLDDLHVADLLICT